MKGIGKVKINKKLLVDALLATVIVSEFPALANKYFFASKPLSGIALNGVGAGAGVLAGMLLKKPDLATLSIAIAGGDVVGNIVSGFVGTTPTTNPTKDFLSLSPEGQPVAGYIGVPGGAMSEAEYASAY